MGLRTVLEVGQPASTDSLVTGGSPISTCRRHVTKLEKGRGRDPMRGNEGGGGPGNMRGRGEGRDDNNEERDGRGKSEEEEEEEEEEEGRQ